ncbi:MAG TPA: response regulator [Pyrinomonadaceae bacterium]|nr:response regulator [Pyrinomonadaceae bacterium]
MAAPPERSFPAFLAAIFMPDLISAAQICVAIRSGALVIYSRRQRMSRTSQPMTILYVEDDQVLRSAITEMFEFEGWRVDACEDGIKALEMIERDKHYDLILLGQDLPGVEGIELARRARSLAHRQHTPLIMLTSSHRESDARAAGVDLFLYKPGGIRDLTGTITRFLKTHSERFHRLDQREEDT